MLGNDDEAADALQDAFCRLWTRREGMADEAEAAALLTTTVRHISIDRLRQRQRHETESCDHTESLYVAEETDIKAEREALYERVEALIDKYLSPLAREILHRRDLQGESIETIAQTLNMQPAAVRMHLSRARKTIRDCYLKKGGNHDT